jgi:hypothetical protein
MERQPYTEPVASERSPTFNGFWPVFLLGLSLLIILSWEIWVGVTTRSGAQRLQEQQVRVVEQSKQVQAGLEKLVRGLVELGKTDEAAQKLVTKFGIKVNEPSATPAPSP